MQSNIEKKVGDNVINVSNKLELPIPRRSLTDIIAEIRTQFINANTTKNINNQNNNAETLRKRKSISPSKSDNPSLSMKDRKLYAAYQSQVISKAQLLMKQIIPQRIIQLHKLEKAFNPFEI